MADFSGGGATTFLPAAGPDIAMSAKTDEQARMAKTRFGTFSVSQAVKLFRSGYDTAQIALMCNADECTIYNQLAGREPKERAKQ